MFENQKNIASYVRQTHSSRFLYNKGLRTPTGRRFRLLGKSIKYGILGVYATLFLIPSYCTASGLYVLGKLKYRQQVSNVSAIEERDLRCEARGYFFYAVTGYLALPLSVVLLLCTPYDLIFDTYERKNLAKIQSFWANLTCKLFIDPHVSFVNTISEEEKSEILKTLIQGKSPNGKGVIFVSNHLSWIDIYVLLSLGLPLKFVAKSEIFLIPLVGWVMHFVGHLKLYRGSRSSGHDIIEQSKNAINHGSAVFFFPEGTRNKKLLFRDSSLPDEIETLSLLPFKLGAFNVASQTGAQIVPIVIHGTEKVMPSSSDKFFYLDSENPISVTLMHPFEASSDPVEDSKQLRKLMHDEYDLLAQAQNE